ncbi:acyl carrier protein [Clostridium aminobutyricum]|uniref:Acyl carrier protein n=1 Tax=Clostridium aminobutyricum TaxID=33953 RepID=A0A939DAD4_CLOAM|nr:acyl carrier protein [Clostridium aminobutyricum]MBN7774060.1 acyl carrier protein [Clostridium aminobutyricum]
MTRDEVLNKVTEVFKEFFDNKDLTITLETTAEDIEDWDSVAHIQLVFELEAAFDIQFEAETIGEMKSIESIVQNTEIMM